jgi:uncharacterized protein
LAFQYKNNNIPIEIRKIKNVNLKGGTVIDGFPCICLTNTIASQCFISSLKTELVAVLDSPGFPGLSIIHNAIPTFPARIYANEDLKLSIFVSELNLDQTLHYSISRIILQWAVENECELIISAAGMTVSQENTGVSSSTGAELKTEKANEIETHVFAAASTTRAVERLANAGVPALSNGSVTGIAALLLNEGLWMNFDVIVLLVKVLKDIPDFRAAAALSKTISKLIPGASCDIASLLQEAAQIEKSLRKIKTGQPDSDVRIYR